MRSFRSFRSFTLVFLCLLAAAWPIAIAGALLLQGVIASGVSILCGLGFEEGTGGAWYVIAVAGILTVLGFVPFWRRRVQNK